VKVDFYLLRVWIRLAFLSFIALITFAVVTAHKLAGKFSLCMPCLRGVLIVAALVVFLGHGNIPPFLLWFSLVSGKWFIRKK
jgi:hypothetical protein